MATHLKGGGQGNADDEILEVGAALLRDFIYERVRRQEDSNTGVTREQQGGRELSDPDHKKLALLLWQIGDELDGNPELQRFIDDASLNPTNDIFLRVAAEIFSDGNISWGRVVALFYFSSRLVTRTLTNRIPNITENVINWTIDYLRENAINWMREQGGWEGLRSQYGTPTWQTVGVFLAGVLTSVLVIYK